MKEFLFSRSHKKHYSSAVVRMGKNNLGFSLVELIIVIAIMAILVAVAIPVLGIFIEKTKVANDKQKVTDILYAVNLAGQSMQYEFDVPQVSNQGLQVPVGFIILNDQGEMIILSNDDTCDTNGNITTIGSDHQEIELMLSDILGSGYNYKLEHDAWGNTTSIPALYGESSELYGEVKALCDILGDKSTMDAIKWAASLIGKNLNTGEYNSGVEALAGVAEMVIAAYPNESAFVTEWTTPAAVEDTFGLSGTKNGVEMKMEAYMAVRRAYNEAVSKYVQSNTSGAHTIVKCTGYDVANSKHIVTTTTEDASTHVSAIVACGTSLAGTNIPDVVAGGLFATVDGEGNVTNLGKDDCVHYQAHVHADKPSGFSGVFNPCYEYKNWQWTLTCTKTVESVGSAGSLADGTQFCMTCKELVNEYAGSSTAREDAKAFYKLMQTLNDTSEEAIADGGNWNYYDGLVEDFAASYENLNKVTANYESCIVITITKGEEGLLYAECNTPGVLDE